LTTETALPQGAPAEASETTETKVAAAENQEQQQDASGQAEGSESDDQGDKEKAKKEKTPEQREIERLRRRVDNLTRQKYELRATAPQQPQQSNQANDDEPVTLTRAELQKYVSEQAQRLAPEVTEQQAEVQRRQGVVASLAKDWGEEKFNTLAAELDEAFGGLADRSGAPKPATEAIFESDDPKAVIEFLTDPDNADEAERIARLNPVQAGKAIAKLELKLAEDKAKAKPKASNAPRPIEAVRGGGVPKGMPDPSNTKAYIAWANAQERAVR
jgi:hypothetical protein